MCDILMIMKMHCQFHVNKLYHLIYHFFLMFFKEHFTSQEVDMAFIIDNCCLTDPIIAKNNFLEIQIKVLKQFLNF